MAIEIRTAFVGSREVNAELKSLIDEFGPRNATGSLRATVRRSVKPLEATIRSRTTALSASGSLARSVGLSIRAGGRRAGGRGFSAALVRAVVGWRRLEVGRTSDGDDGNATARLQQALGVEYGNVRWPAPAGILRSSLDAHSGRIVSEFTGELRRQVDRARVRLARRRSAGRLRIR